MREMNHSLRALLVSGAEREREREKAVFVHPQSDMLPRLLTFFYLTSWHERCNLLLYEFWVTLRPVGRTCLSIAACSVMGQEAGLAIKAPVRRPAQLKIPRLHLNETRGGNRRGKSP